MTVPKTLDTPYQSPRIFGPEYRAASLGILLVVTLIAFEGMSIGAVMPAVSQDLDALDLYGMSFSAFLIAGLLANVVAGLWSDRRGHAWPFLLGVSLLVATAGGAGALLYGVDRLHTTPMSAGIATGYTVIVTLMAAVGVLGVVVAGRMRDVP